MGNEAKNSLVVTIVVDGENMMGDALCRMHGVLVSGKRVKHLNYSGPVSSAKELAEVIADLFTEPQP